MIVRKLQSGKVIEIDLQYTEEEEIDFIAKNSGGDFMKIDSLPVQATGDNNYKMENDVIVIDVDANLLDVTEKRYTRLEIIFNSKATKLKSLAIGKPNMKDPEAINNQYRVYEEMYKNAMTGLYDEDTNNAIITANQTAKTTVAPFTLLLNTVKTVLEYHIENNSPGVDNLLTAADSISLDPSKLTLETVNDIKTAFGL